MTDRPSLKLEIPLPKWPTSPTFRFTLRTLIVAVFFTATAFAIYIQAQKSERAQHTGGYFRVVLALPDGMMSTNLRCVEYPTVLELIDSQRLSLHTEHDVNALWPPTIWIHRPDWGSPNLETKIVVPCAGTKENPQIDPSTLIKLGDSVFVDYGRPLQTSRGTVCLSNCEPFE